MGSLWPFSVLSVVKLHELRFLISPPLHNGRPERWSFVNAESLLTASHLMSLSSSPHISQPLSVWPFSMLLYWQVWTHPSLLVFTPCSQSLSVAQWQPRTKKTLLSCSLSTFSSLLFLLFCSIFVSVKLGLVKAQATYFWDKQSHSESLQVSRDSCQVCGFFSFSFLLVREKGCKLVSWGILLCWLQETDALQEFWKQIRLTLFSGPWMLFSPTCREQSNLPTFLI